MTIRKLLITLLFSLMLAPSTLWAGETGTQESVADVSAQVEAILMQVENDKVCMVNDRYMGSEQIPVEVEGKTYYGCCMMCKAKLEKSTGLRTAVDPVSGIEVDKATAIIGTDEYHQVYYFENAEHLASFDPNILSEPSAE